MTRLTHTHLNRLRDQISAGNAVLAIFRNAGFSGFLEAEIDQDCATLVLRSSAHPDAIAALLDSAELPRQTIDFHEDPLHWHVTWQVFYGVHELAVVCHHDKRAQRAAMYREIQAMREAA